MLPDYRTERSKTLKGFSSLREGIASAVPHSPPITHSGRNSCAALILMLKQKKPDQTTRLCSVQNASRLTGTSCIAFCVEIPDFRQRKAMPI